MITVTQAFEEFRQRLELSDTEQQDTIRRHQDVRACIEEEFDLANSFLTGSYARHTKTKPLKDVDIFCVLGEKESHWRNKQPDKILKAFKTSLAKAYGADAVELGRRCVTIEFDKRNPTVDEEGKLLSIDAVPAFKVDGVYEIPDGVIGEWIRSDPSVHKEQATAKNKELDGKWVPLVKMLKRWNRSNGKPIKPSFLIEVMAHELVDGPFSTYPSEVRRFFASASEAIHRDWPDPAGLGPPVSDQMTPEMRQAAAKALRQAELQAAHAMRLEKDGSRTEALMIWKQIMSRYFPTS